jgi:hypothetical protein
MDSAVIGLGYVSALSPVAVYSKRQIYAKLAASGLSKEDADEYYVGKFMALWAGEHTPVVLDDTHEEQQ